MISLAIKAAATLALASLAAASIACGASPESVRPAAPTPDPVPTLVREPIPTATSVPAPTTEPIEAEEVTDDGPSEEDSAGGPDGEVTTELSTQAEDLAAPDVTEELGVELQALPSLADLVDQIRPSVVSITAEGVRASRGGTYSATGVGSGVIIRRDGLIATNAHVVGGLDDIRVHLADSEIYDAELVGLDLISDLAVLRIARDDLPQIALSGSESLRVGDWVLAMGNAEALGGDPTVTLGIVSGRGRTIVTSVGELYELIQTDAAMNDGSSGGPLIDLQGNVVGIAIAMMPQAQGIGFAVSSSVAAPILDSIIESGRYVRPLIGMTGMDARPEMELGIDDGVLITTTPFDGPAYEAGIRVGDVITALEGVPTPNMSTFLPVLWSFSPGDEISVTYFSDGEIITTTLTLDERPQ